jgi:hypothetical protein
VKNSLDTAFDDGVAFAKIEGIKRELCSAANSA